MKKGIVLGIIISIVFVSFVIAANYAFNSADVGTLFSYDEDVSNVFNITVNNSEVGIIENFTSVVITVPAGFIIANSTNVTSAGDNLLIISATTLNWTNVTQYIVNGSSNETFVFNATVSAPGHYIISVDTYNGSLVYESNITVEINDTTVPSSIQFVSPTPANGTGLALESIPINVTATDNYNISNIIIYVMNSTWDIINTSVSVQNATAIYFNFTNYTDGNYYINASVNDSLNNVNISEIRTIRIDNGLGPSAIEYASGGSADGANLSTSAIVVNVTATVAVAIDTLIIELYNSTIDRVNYSTFEGSPGYISFNGHADGVYYANATVNNTVGTANRTVVTRKYMVDTVVPVVALTSTSSTSSSITVAVTNSDTGGSGVITTCSASPQGGITGTGASQILTDTGLSCADSYYYTVTCTDRAGNIGRASASFTTSSCGGNSFAVGGGGGTSNTWTNTFIANTNALKTGYSQALSVKERIKLQVDKTTHYVGLKSITATTATVEVTSTPQEATLSIGDVRKFDVTDDQIYDLSIELKSIVNGKATFVTTLIEEQVTKESEKEQEVAAEEATQRAKEEMGIAEESMSVGKIIAIIVLIILILALIVWLVKNKN